MTEQNDVTLIHLTHYLFPLPLCLTNIDLHAFPLFCNPETTHNNHSIQNPNLNLK